MLGPHFVMSPSALPVMLTVACGCGLYRADADLKKTAEALPDRYPARHLGEPTGALDLATSRQMLGLLRRLNRDLGKTVVLITHNGAIAAVGAMP